MLMRLRDEVQGGQGRSTAYKNPSGTTTVRPANAGGVIFLDANGVLNFDLSKRECLFSLII